MSEIYRNTAGLGLVFPISGSTPSKAKYVRNGSVVAEYTSAPDLQSNTAKIPYEIVHISGPFTVEWTYSVSGTEYTVKEEHDVVTPMFTKQSLVDWDSDFESLSETKVRHLESLVRKIIETYCHQKFEYEKGTKYFVGTGTFGVTTDVRVISLENNAFKIKDGNFGLTFAGYNHGTAYNAEGVYSYDYNVKVPIEADMMEGYLKPRLTFKNGATYAVAGEFGWHSIPEQVKTAARYLAEAFTCDESLWRERYIKSVRAADWRFDFSGEAFVSTGSLIADQLLEPFVVKRYAIV